MRVRAGILGLVRTILTPSSRSEDDYTWCVTAIGHAWVGALLAPLGPAAAPFRLLASVAHWTLKERGDLRRGGSWRDGLVDTGFVGVGTLYTGPWWWPYAIGVAVVAGLLARWSARRDPIWR
ncbi:hypothetical protein [Rhodovulum visakhapatnamense]|uniref:Uncharacterized protein n=1 Tax=Rhodovulum visakhapatnamense TaxID=364297 RepID=A0A4R8GCG0_9RHOB|nr:hypothetical protein [Rhodovulum visakhapatnamense]TDX33420.1 hypothetical protein EV657_102299 [Rhodovulum visakhapatnamense]